jgi:mono/diheme cytochrome c family protein
MQKWSHLSVVLALAVVLLAGCGGGGGEQGGSAGGATGGNVENGQAIFTRATVGSNPGCATCHSLDGSQLVGPTMQGIGTRAATRVEGQSAQDYLHASIVDPNAYVVEGFAQGVMPSYQDALQETELNDLVAYLLSLN